MSRLAGVVRNKLNGILERTKLCFGCVPQDQESLRTVVNATKALAC